MRCYCHGMICGRTDLTDGARLLHLNAEVNWGAQDTRDPWTGSYDFGSFACVQQWAADRSEQHDGRVLTSGIDADPAPVSDPPVEEATLPQDATLVVEAFADRPPVPSRALSRG